MIDRILLTAKELNKLTKAQLIDLLTEGLAESVPDPIAYRPDGQPERMGSTVKDARGNVIGYQTVEFTITVTEKDAAGKVVGGHRVKHYTDGRQPEMLPLQEDAG